MSKQPILITGAHRSGSTWVGNIVAKAENIGYLHEPFNLNRPHCKKCNFKFRYWFEYIDSDNEEKYLHHLDHLLKFESYYDWTGVLGKERNLKRAYYEWLQSRKLKLFKKRSARLVMKDPLALMAASWLAEKFNMKTLVLIRHPAAFVSSLKRMNWTYPFDNLVKQQNLMAKHLSEFREQIIEFAETEKDIIDQGILMWNILHKKINDYKEKHSEWLYIRHEDISRDPQTEFRNIFKHLELDINDNIKEEINKSSHSSNPAEAPSKKGKFIKRDSRANIYNWKKRLTDEEIKRIKDGTDKYASYFYQQKDWNN
ncbi:MAG: sulfotransferase [bacterium]